MKLLFSGLALLLIVSMVSAYEWEVVELGGADSANPYTGGTVEFLPNGFTVTADGGEIWDAKLGATIALSRVDLAEISLLNTQSRIILTTLRTTGLSLES